MPRLPFPFVPRSVLWAVAAAFLTTFPALTAASSTAGQTAAAAPTLPALPWNEQWTMTLRDAPREFVRFRGGDYLRIRSEELADRAFVQGKDVVFAALLQRSGEVASVRLLGVDLPLVAKPELWATQLDGDSLWIFAQVAGTPARPELHLRALAPAPSPRQLMQERLSVIAAADFPARLAAAEWARGQGGRGGRDAWQAIAEEEVVAVVEAAAALAGERRDGRLLEQAIEWCLSQLQDHGRAARLASATWLASADAASAERLAKRMKDLGHRLYRGRWQKLGDSLIAEYDDRFRAIGPLEAEAYFQLGRWVDAHAEFLPLAKERAYRCFEAGLRGDPNHRGIRRELGLPAIAVAAASTVSEDLIDDGTGIVVPAPPAWRRRAGAEASWADPAAETAWMGAALVRTEPGMSFDQLWEGQLAIVQGKTGFALISREDLTIAAGRARLATFSWRDGSSARRSQIALAYSPTGAAAVRLEGHAADDEQQRISDALRATLGVIRIPAPGASATAPAQAP